jgi:hypothetical protein
MKKERIFPSKNTLRARKSFCVENGRESEGKIAGNRETRFPVQLVREKRTRETRRQISNN